MYHTENHEANAFVARTGTRTLAMMVDEERDRILRDLVMSPANRCFGCSPTNERGLGLHVREHEGWTQCRFVPEDWHQGWQHVVHGGILATVLDEVMGYVLYFRGLKCVTARMEVRYRAPVTQGEALTVRARIVRETRKTADVESQILRRDRIVTEGLGRFVKLGSILDEGRPAEL
ncbi:MAG: hypothetical protein PVSMB7_12810 [Chloroflexota bacterium]